jgi:O-antigen ligase
MSERSGHLLAGAVAVAFLAATSRWGSHIGVGPLYVTDLLVAAAFVHASGRSATRQQLTQQPLIWLLVGWVVLRFLLGGHFNGVALRDFAPYLYAVVALLSAYAADSSPPSDRSRTMRLLWVALYLHAVWCAVAILSPHLLSGAPSVGGVQVFELRDDFDGAMLAVLAGLAFVRWGRDEGFKYFLVVMGAAFLTLSMTSRAGLLAMVGALFFATAYLWRQGAEKSRWRLSIVPVVAVVAAIVLPTTFAGSRLVATFGDTSAEQRYLTEHASAAGTTNARERAWKTLTHWIVADQNRTIVGVGFGPDFLKDSGADVQLLGAQVASTNTVRSPHEYFLGSWARLGLIGLALLVAIVLRALRHAWAFRDRRRDELSLLAGLLVTTFVITASVGVMLESPFGAIPFFWSIGLLASDHRRPRISAHPVGADDATSQQRQPAVARGLPSQA